MKKIAIIGGSGLDNPSILKNPKLIEIKTPYGKPSTKIKHGLIADKDLFIIARHGLEHTIPPTQVNNRANIWALKNIGVDCIITTTAVGSLRENIERGDLVILDQFIDFTRKRELSFFDTFESGKMQHTPMADPFDASLRQSLIEECQLLKYNHHTMGTVVTIEGPRFSTRAESQMFRAWGADVINMSIAPECILANEMKIPYVSVAMSTDYDSWREGEIPVSWEEVIKVFNENVGKVTNLLVNVIEKI